MKKLLTILGIVSGIAIWVSCESSDSCHCEVFENIGTEEQPQLRYIGSLDGTCDGVNQEENKVYQNVSCD
ncbi:hypothetical protein SAMN02927937_01081 [Paenimyroides aquimaris]|uniref:Uncharacterized protein n=1 Tax=Paenimyroides marinum TaxID=1159016 RepID=A0A1H6KLC4_9FLAO|nr:hypothetical protein [Paenimyroides aquimaris]SEH72635.1 hypothetical protein SAMN02927937_01081 [Paenimyroides aquimaris]